MVGFEFWQHYHFPDCKNILFLTCPQLIDICLHQFLFLLAIASFQHIFPVWQRSKSFYISLFWVQSYRGVASRFKHYLKMFSVPNSDLKSGQTCWVKCVQRMSHIRPIRGWINVTTQKHRQKPLQYLDFMTTSSLGAAVGKINWMHYRGLFGT